MTYKTREEVQSFLDSEFPKSDIVIESLGNNKSVLRKIVNSEDFRPGKTISGPTLMALADAAIYMAIIGENISQHAVTTQLSINFLRKPNGNKDIIAKCELLKIGKSLVMGEVKMFSQGEADVIAHATATYSIPAR